MPTKRKPRRPKKRTCEIRFMLVCNDQGVHRRKGRKKSDPEFDCCLACWAYLSRQGVKTTEVSNAD